MKVNILAFGIARDIVSGSTIQLEIPGNATVADLKQTLSQHFPDFNKLTSLQVAVNNEYAADTHCLSDKDEVVLIPPVSGG